MPDPQQIDLSAGFVPKSGGGQIDLSAGFKAKPQPPPPEGFWHSLGTQVAGIPQFLAESLSGQSAVPNPQVISALAGNVVEAGRQAKEPISPATGLPIPDPFGYLSKAHAAAALLTPVGGGSLEKGLEQLESGNVKGAAGTAVGAALPLAAGKLLPGAEPELLKGATSPKHIEALTGFLKSTKTDPNITASTALPEARAVASREGIDPATFQGRKGGEIVTGQNGILHKAIQEHRAEYATLRQPVLHEPMDTTSIAQAYLGKITPELRANAPQVANRLQAEAGKFATIGKDGRITGVKPQPLSQLDDFRIRLNNELDSYEQSPIDKQLRSDIEVKADKAAANAARDLVYKTISSKTGTPEPYIRDLQQRQGALIEARRDLTKAFNDASGAQGEAVAGSLKANPEKILTMREKAGHLYPSRHGVERSLIREVVSPKPLDLFNNRLRMMFGGLESTPAPSGGVTAPIAPSAIPVSGGRTGGGSTPETAPIYDQDYQGPISVEALRTIKENSELPTSLRRAAQGVHEAVVDSGMSTSNAMRLNGTDELAKRLGGRFEKTINAINAPSAPSGPVLGPGAPGLSGTTRSISLGRAVGPSPGNGFTNELEVSGKSIGHVTYTIDGDTATIHHFGAPAGQPGVSYDAASNTLGTSGIRALAQQFAKDHPEVKYVQGVRIGGSRAAEARSARVPIASLLRESRSTGASPSAQAQVRPPYAPTAQLSPQQKATAWFLAAKRGDISQQEADRQARKLVGSGGSKLRRPVEVGE